VAAQYQAALSDGTRCRKAGFRRTLHECDSRHERRCCPRAAGVAEVPASHLIKNFDIRAGGGICRSRLTSLVLRNWIDTDCAVLLTGAHGCGPTWLACALGQYACHKGHNARHLRTRPASPQGSAHPADFGRLY
jgi:DNA replication protein DnaC